MNDRSTCRSVFCRKFRSFGTILCVGELEPRRLWLKLSTFKERRFKFKFKKYIKKTFKERRFKWKSRGIWVSLLCAKFKLIILSKVCGLPVIIPVIITT